MAFDIHIVCKCYITWSSLIQTGFHM